MPHAARRPRSWLIFDVGQVIERDVRCEDHETRIADGQGEKKRTITEAMEVFWSRCAAFLEAVLRGRCVENGLGWHRTI